MSPKKRFSVRQVKTEPSPTVEDAPEALRYFLLRYFEQRYRGGDLSEPLKIGPAQTSQSEAEDISNA